MSEELTSLALSFLALMITMDPVGNVPFYISLTDGMTDSERRRVLVESVATAFVVGLGFLLVGKGLLAVLGVTVSDFKIAGGLLLVVLGVAGLLAAEHTKRDPEESSVGAVPIGVPLICGPAVITLLIVRAEELRPLPVALTAVAYVANLAIVWVAFSNAARIERLLGRPGSRAVSRVVMVILSAYGVMLVRAGVQEAIAAAA